MLEKSLETVARTTNYFKDGQNQDMITLAVDNDAADSNFITRIGEKDSSPDYDSAYRSA